MTSPRDAEQPTQPTDEERPYFGFISYAREDEQAARHIQAALQRVGMPYSMWGRRKRPYWRDSSDLSAGGRPWRDQAFPQLQRSRSLVVVCSPHVYNSRPVSEEIDHWLTDAGHGLPGVRPADRLFLVRMEGSLRWDAETGSYGESSTAAPLALRQPGVFEHEPSYVDLKDIDPLDSDNPLVREQFAGIVAEIRPCSRESEGELGFGTVAIDWVSNR